MVKQKNERAEHTGLKAKTEAREESEGLTNYGKKLIYYAEGNGKPLRTFKQRNDKSVQPIGRHILALSRDD